MTSTCICAIELIPYPLYNSWRNFALAQMEIKVSQGNENAKNIYFSSQHAKIRKKCVKYGVSGEKKKKQLDHFFWHFTENHHKSTEVFLLLSHKHHKLTFPFNISECPKHVLFFLLLIVNVKVAFHFIILQTLLFKVF